MGENDLREFNEGQKPDAGRLTLFPAEASSSPVRRESLYALYAQHVEARRRESRYYGHPDRNHSLRIHLDW